MPNVFNASSKSYDLQNELLDSVEKATMSGSWILNIERSEFLVSANFLRLTESGLNPCFNFQSFQSAIAVEDHSKLSEWLGSLRAGKPSFVRVRFNATNRESKEFIIIASGFSSNEAQNICYGTLHPASESKLPLNEIEQNLKEQNNYIQKITSTVPDMLSIIHLPTKSIRFINDEEFMKHGFDPDEMHKNTTDKLRHLVHPDDIKNLDEYYAALAKANDESIITAEYRAKGKSEQWQWFYVRGKVFTRSETGSVEDILNVIENITQRKDADEKLSKLNAELENKNRQLEALTSELRTFYAVAATDYREPLQSVYNALEMIIVGDAKNLSNPSRANLRRAQSYLQKLNLLTEDIVSFAHIQKEDRAFNTVDLNEVIKLVLYDLKTPIANTSATINSKNLPLINGDALQIHLLFNHILSNAVKFRKENEAPVIFIDSEITELKKENAEAVKYHVIKVHDNGIGFDASDADRIFEIFVKLHEKKYKGSGIGLAICKKIIEQHKGFIRAVSALNEGTTIECWFPATS